MPKREKNIAQHRTRDESSYGASQVSDAKFARAEILSWICGLWESFERRLAKFGFSAEESRSLFAQAVAKVDGSLPAFVCPVCKGSAEDAKCKCRGRGWFGKTEERKYVLAAASMVRRAIGEGTKISESLKINAKLQRSYKQKYGKKPSIIEAMSKELGFEIDKTDDE